jgi:peptidoglycan/LPS O-acetylase OafA/YrhL
VAGSKEEQAGRPGSHLAGIQMLRGFAACAVAFHHALEMSNGGGHGFSPDWLTTAGAAGVDVFFVISGFIMPHVSFPARGAPLGPIAFLGRRAQRIYPFYWLFCLAMLALGMVGFLRHQDQSGGTILRSFLLLPSDYYLVGVAWTLVYEIYFYLLFALLLPLRSVTVATVVPAGLILTLMGLSGLLPDGALRRFLGDPIALEFCFGLLLNLAWRRWRSGWPRSALPAWIGAAAMIMAPMTVALPSTHGLPDDIRFLAWGLPAALIVASSLGWRGRAGHAGRAAAIIGDASYAIYLSHVFVMIGYGWLLKRPDFAAMPQAPWVLAITLLCVAVGLACHILVEKPLLALLHRYRRRPAPALEPSAVLP